MVEIYAHRGLHRHTRENTLNAFRGAALMRCDGVELDVRQSADGALVVHHDPSIEGRAIASTDAKYLPSYVPTLEDALAACGDLRVNVEIKNLREPDEPTYDDTGAFAQGVVALIERMDRAEGIVISSFDLATCASVRALAPEMAVGWLLDWRLDPMASLASAHALRLDALHPYFGVVEAPLVTRAHQLGMALNVWTVDTEGDIVAMIELGVDAVITNEPALALALARSRPGDRI